MVYHDQSRVRLMCSLALSLQERSYGTNVPCPDRDPSDTVPVSGMVLWLFVIEPLHLMTEGEQNWVYSGEVLISLQKNALLTVVFKSLFGTM